MSAWLNTYGALSLYMWFRIWGQIWNWSCWIVMFRSGVLNFTVPWTLVKFCWDLRTPSENAFNWSVAICFFGLSSYFTENTVCLSYACRQMVLRPQLEPHREQGLFQLCICRHPSSASVRTSQRTISISVMHLSSDVSSAPVWTSQRTRCVPVMYLSPDVSSASVRTSQRTRSVPVMYVVRCFFGRSSNLTDNTACLNFVSVIRCYLGLSSYVTGTESVPTMKSGHKVGLRMKRLILSDLTKIGQRCGDNCTTNTIELQIQLYYK